MIRLARFSMTLAALAASCAFAQGQKRDLPALFAQIEKADAVVEGAKDRAAALRENETRYRAKSYDGGIKAAAKVPPDLAIELEDNFTLMGQFGMSGTPALIWKDSKGRVQTHLGLPRLSKLPAITGLPEQKIDDPELAKYR